MSDAIITEDFLARELRQRFIKDDDCRACDNTGDVPGNSMSEAGHACNRCGRGISIETAIRRLENGNAKIYRFWKVRLFIQKDDMEMTATYSHLKASMPEEAEASAIVAAAKEFEIAEREWQVETTEVED